MRNIIDSIIRVLCTAIMGIMVVAVCWQVITRYVLNNPSTVTEEALRYLLVWTTMVGAAYAYGKRKHLSINILFRIEHRTSIHLRTSLLRPWEFPCPISTAVCW